MKYIVEVNAKYLVSIEADSALNAEHKILDYNGIWGALAFDNKMIKTDTFLGAVQGCEMISMNDLIEKVNVAMAAKLEAAKAMEEEKNAEAEFEKIEAMLKAAKENWKAAQEKAHEAKQSYWRAENELGKQRI